MQINNKLVESNEKTNDYFLNMDEQN